MGDLIAGYVIRSEGLYKSFGKPILRIKSICHLIDRALYFVASIRVAVCAVIFRGHGKTAAFLP